MTNDGSGTVAGMTSGGYSIDELARQIRSITRDIERMEEVKVNRREHDLLARRAETLESKFDRLMDAELVRSRQNIAQLIGIIVTMIVAAIGAFT